MPEEWGNNARVGVLQSNAPDRQIDNETLNIDGETVYRQRVQNYPAILRKLLDYSTRTDGNPVYVGTNSQEALVADTDWAIQKLFYDTSDRLIDAQILKGAWTNRTNLAWRSAGGN